MGCDIEYLIQKRVEKIEKELKLKLEDLEKIESEVKELKKKLECYKIALSVVSEILQEEGV